MNLINKFRRTTHSTSFIPEIDGLRFFAIVTVIFYHLNTAYLKNLGLTFTEWKVKMGTEDLTQPAWWFVRLDVGVKVFFAISGFILAMPFLKQYLNNGKKVQLGDYFVRRLTRLEPPFIISLIVFYVVQVFFLHEDFGALFPHFFAGLTYTHVFFYGEPNPINPVTWSLETEAQFYIILPFLMTLLFAIRLRLFRLLFIFLTILLSIYAKSYFFYEKVPYLESSIFAYLTNFASGVFFAWLFLSFQSFFKKDKHILFDLVGLVAIFMMFTWYKPQAYWLNNILLNLSILGLFLAVFKGQLFNWFFTRPWVYLLGGMCYSLYLLHFAFFFLVVKYSSKIPSMGNYWFDLMVQFVIVIPLFLVVAGIFFLLIEKPCMNKDWISNLMKTIKIKLGLI